MPKSIKKLEKSDFITMVSASINAPLSETECKQLDNAYNQFIDQIQRISKYEKRSKLDSLRLLARIRERTLRLLESFPRKNSLQYSLLKSAVALICFEQKLIYLQLQYPQSLSDRPAKKQSKLYLSKKCSQSYLMELLSSLDSAGICVYDNGEVSAFIDLVAGFEWLFNIHFNNCYEMRRRILMRKRQKTPFLDKLKALHLKKMDS